MLCRLLFMFIIVRDIGRSIRAGVGGGHRLWMLAIPSSFPHLISSEAHSMIFWIWINRLLSSWNIRMTGIWLNFGIFCSQTPFVIALYFQKVCYIINSLPDQMFSRFMDYRFVGIKRLSNPKSTQPLKPADQHMFSYFYWCSAPIYVYDIGKRNAGLAPA